MISNGLETCAFCRDPMADNVSSLMMERVRANDPAALSQMGADRRNEGDYDTALEYLAKAADLGDLDAHYELSVMYGDGEGVEKDEEKKVYHLEEAAIGGHPNARYNLGANEWNNGRYDRAMKHYIIAANLGQNEALDRVKQGFVDGIVNKEDYAAALRGHQAAVDATKSEQRDAAYAFDNLSPEEQEEQIRWMQSFGR